MSTEARGTTLDWSFAMNPSQLPPKSPGSFPGFGAATGPVDSTAAAAGRATSLPHRSGAHKRTPSAGYLPQAHPTWVDAGEGAVSKPGGAAHVHRRAASESCMAFLHDDGTALHSNMVDDADLPRNADVDEDDDDLESRSAASLHSAGHSGGGSVDFDIDRLDEDQLMSMFGDGNEPAQKQLQPHPLSQPGSARKSNPETTTAGRASSANSAGGSEARAATERRPPKLCNGDPGTPSDCSNSNSMSEVSADDPKGGLGSVYQSEPDVQSSGDRDGGSAPQSFAKGEPQAALAGPDSSLDPKRAKRILANRQSAQRSRVRKLQYISELERTVAALQSEVSTMAPQVAFFEHRRAVLSVDNNAIKQKMAALVQGQLYKDAHNEALQKEVQRLRQLFQQQQHSQSMQQQHRHSQSAPPTTSDDRRHRQFHELELGITAQPSEASLAVVPVMFADPVSCGSASPTRPRAHAVPQHSLNTMVASTW